jgi:hypothetical protein
LKPANLKGENIFVVSRKKIEKYQHKSKEIIPQSVDTDEV